MLLNLKSIIKPEMKYKRMKEVWTDIADIAFDTGYDELFLCDCVEELVADGQSYESAVKEVRQIAEEFDY